MKKFSHILIAIIFLDVTSAFCQITTFHGGGLPSGSLDGWSGHLKGNSIAITKDGKYVVGGVIDERDVSGWPYLLKTSISGANAWQRVYLGDSARYRGSIRSVRDYGAGIVVAAGHINNGGFNHALFLKIDGGGNILAKKAFRLVIPSLEEDWNEVATCIQVVRNAGGTPIGTVLIGYNSNTTGFIHLTDGNGEPLVSRTVWPLPTGVVQVSDGFLVLFDFIPDTFIIKKYSNDLTILWQKEYRLLGGSRYIHPGTITKVGSMIYVTGSVTEVNRLVEHSPSALLMQLSEDGTFNWAKTYGSNSTSLSLAAKPEINGVGGLYLTGKVRSADQDRAYILNTDFYGNRKWSKVYTLENAASEGREIITTKDSLIVTGVNGNNMFLIRTDPLGLSGQPCEFSVPMPATPYDVSMREYSLGGSAVPRYLEMETTRLDKFNVTQAFCDWDTTIPPYLPGLGALDPSVVVYPTLATTTVNIELKSPSDVEGSVTLFDTYEKLHVQTIPPGISKVTLDISRLSPGLYYLLISSNGKTTTSKFIKQ